MVDHSDQQRAKWHEALRGKILGLGKRSIRKNQYSELQSRLQELRESREKYRAVFHSANDAILIQDAATGKILEVNARAEELLGLPRAQIIQLDLHALSAGEPPYTHEDARAWMEKALTSGPQVFGWRFRRADGELFWTEVSMHPARICDEDRMIIAARDVEDRKQAHETLQQREQFLQDVFDAIQDGISVLDRDLNIIRANGWMQRAYPQQAPLEGKKCYAVYQQRDAQCPWCPTVKAIETGERQSTEVPYPSEHDMKGWIDLSAFPIKNERGEITGVIEYVKDISDRKRAEQAVRESEQRYRTLFDSVTDALFIHDTDGRTLEVNHVACERLGYTRAELLQLMLHDVDTPDHAEQDDRRMVTLRETGSCLFETVHQCKDGSTLPVEVNSRIIDYGGQSAVLSVARDITDRREAERERAQLEAQLRHSQKMEAVGQLAGGVAHDFNNLLTTIMGNVSLSIDTVRDMLGSSHNAVQSMEQIEQATQRASTLTRQLLTFSRRDVMRPEVLNLNSILANLDKMLRRLITANVQLKTVTEPDLKTVRADNGQIEQVVVNLVINAVQAMPAGGCLMLETQNVVLDEDYVRNHAEARTGPYVILTVSDTGHGMDSATIERVFEPFFTTKPVGEGTGLGLSTVHGIVKRSGGHVVVNSEPGHGSTFKVYLPATGAVTGENAPALPPGPAPCGHEHIILCEDDGPVRHLITEALRNAGYTVDSAGSGRACIKAAQKDSGSIELLITDVVMPDMNGKVLSERLRAICPGLPTLFISGYTSNVIAHHGVLDAGVEFLEKPFSQSCLLAKVRAVLDKARAQP